MRSTVVLLAIGVPLLASGCSVRKMAVRSLADALTGGAASVYAADDDPALVGQALPFALKTIESLLQAAPGHKGLLLAAASGFVQYAHAYVLRPAQAVEFTDLAAARAGKNRAKRLFLRASRYGLRALAVDNPDIGEALRTDPARAAATVGKQDVPALYWTGVALGSAISVAKNDMALVGDLPLVLALLQRALALDESWHDGAIHEFFIAYAAGRSEAEGGGLARAREHFERAMALNRGRSIAPLVTFAESVCVRQQDRARFQELLAQALQFDVEKYPDHRLANLLSQQKAQQLLDNIDNLFFLDEADGARDGSGSSTKNNSLD